MLAPLSSSDVVVFVSDIPAPVQVVATAGVVAISRLPGSVALKLDWMSVKPFGFDRVMASVATPFSPTLAGEKDSATVGADGFTFNLAGHAVALVPADMGAVLVAEFAVSVTDCTSTLPAESVTVNVSIPAMGFTVTCGVWAPLTMIFAGIRSEEHTSELQSPCNLV